MTTISVEIPKLSVGQSVESWRNLYVAATGSLKPAQQLALLPNYIDRTSGDHEIAKLAALESTLDKALNVIETLIDGERTIYKSINEFCDMKSEGLKDWQSLYFRLKKIGKESGLSNNIVFIRFLGLVPCGRKFFRDNEKAICEEGLSDEIMLGLYIKVKQALDKTGEPSGARKTQVKEEDYTFTSEETSAPSWAIDLQNEVAKIKNQLNCLNTSASEPDDEEVTEPSECYYTPVPRSNKRSDDHRRKDTMKCYECGKTGHFAMECFKKKCTNCNGKGHSANCQGMPNKEKS